MIKKADFYRDYIVTHATPAEVSKHHVTVSTLINTVREFFDSEFPGLINIDSEPVWEPGACVRISEDYTAYFLKKLIASAYGNGEIAIDMTFEEKAFFLRVQSKEKLPITFEEMNDILLSAQSAGFEYRLTKNTLLLEAEITVFKKLTSIRSISSNILRAKFVEIFFTGAPDQETLDLLAEEEPDN